MKPTTYVFMEKYGKLSRFHQRHALKAVSLDRKCLLLFSVLIKMSY